MRELFFLELKKILFKKKVGILTFAFMFMAFKVVGNFSPAETWADMFSKMYMLSPLFGVIIFTVASGIYTVEYESGMDDIIKTTAYGRKKIHMCKVLAAGVSASLLSLGIMWSMVISSIINTKGIGMDLTLNKLWVFQGNTWNITVSHMIILMTITITAGSVFFSLIGVFLSSISRTATVPFIFGGLIMGIPFAFSIILGALALVTPLWGMMVVPIARFNAPISIMGVHALILLLALIFIPNWIKKNFLKKMD